MDLTVRQLFEAPTVERLALLVEAMLAEQRIAAIWADLLGRKYVGLDDNFFDLGGQPELIAALQQRIATAFGRRIPIAELFHSPTVPQQVQLSRRLGMMIVCRRPECLHRSLLGLATHLLGALCTRKFGEGDGRRSTFLVCHAYRGGPRIARRRALSAKHRGVSAAEDSGNAIYRPVYYRRSIVLAASSPTKSPPKCRPLETKFGSFCWWTRRTLVLPVTSTR